MSKETAEQNRKARQREYYLKHREKMLAYSRRYLQEHPEKRKLYQENAARKRANGTGYYQRYYQRHKERLLACSKQWHQDHPEKVKEYQRRYYQKKTAAKREKKKPNPDIDKAKSLFLILPWQNICSGFSITLQARTNKTSIRTWNNLLTRQKYP